MSLLTFLVVGLVGVIALRLLVPRTRLVPLAWVLSTGLVGATSTGFLAAAIAHEGPWHLVFPTGFVFSVVGAVVSLLWLDALLARNPPGEEP